MLTCAVAYRVREPTLPHHDSGNPEQHFLPEESQETAYELFHFYTSRQASHHEIS